jgi:hypothetical protein
MHTWKTKDGTQNVRDTILPQKIDYEEYKLLSPDFYKLDDEDEFLKNTDMSLYFYKDVWEKIGDKPSGEWWPDLVSNHVCMLESQKRGLAMIEASVSEGCKFKYVMFIRPDMTIESDFPVASILSNPDKIHIPDYASVEGINAACAMMNYEYAQLYGNRIDGLAEFRKNHGRTVAEVYCMFILRKYNMKINMVDFKYSLTRP